MGTHTRGPLLAVALLLAAPTFLRGQHADTTVVPERYLQGRPGSFVLYDTKHDTYTRYRPAACAQRHSPASTFKIPNSLVGLETGVIGDEHFVIPWDSVARAIPAWNRDHDLASAITHSVVWYYQELARRVGPDLMKKFVRAFAYGNMDVSGPPDRFWLGSTLEISADEQVTFLRKLVRGDLPCSRRSLDIVRRILVLEKTDDHVLRGKTGFTGESSGEVVGWFVGYVEKGDNTYVFALNITSADPKGDAGWIFENRKASALLILRDLGIL